MLVSWRVQGPLVTDLKKEKIQSTKKKTKKQNKPKHVLFSVYSLTAAESHSLSHKVKGHRLWLISHLKRNNNTHINTCTLPPTHCWLSSTCWFGSDSWPLRREEKRAQMDLNKVGVGDVGRGSDQSRNPSSALKAIIVTLALERKPTAVKAALIGLECALQSHKLTSPQGGAPNMFVLLFNPHHHKKREREWLLGQLQTAETNRKGNGVYCTSC